MSRSRRAAGIGAAVLVSSVVLGGCEFKGLNSLPLPGTEGSGGGAWTVQVEMPNVTTIDQNSPVRVDDVIVGKVSGIELVGWHAKVTLSLNEDVQLPANATAMIGQTSLLGSNHVELNPPVSEAPVGQLQPGATIPLSQAGAYPTTEQTLSSLSVVLNGGGLSQIQEIASELNNALKGREDSVRSLFTQLNTLLTGLDTQKQDIIRAMEGLNRLAGQVAQQNQVLGGALDSIPPALAVLNQQRADLTTTLASLGNLGYAATRVVTSSKDDLIANLQYLSPSLAALADAGKDLPESLSVLGTFPFPMNSFKNAFHGDYANLGITIDLTLARTDSALLKGTPFYGVLTQLQNVLQQNAGQGTTAADPLQAPLNTPPQQQPPSQALPGQPAGTGTGQ
ncbi:MCE family protein [Rhodococcus sp. X156]|uniref:MCE family protein n=1 Tax=Rhodococcus sp. X156 TaxID=2499145 RepID=UPI000FDB5C1F|nr:MCE family protein [Rhodococcus sp. X156]